MSDRSFGNEIGNTTTMNATNEDESIDVSLVKLENQMEKDINVSSRISKPLATELYTKIHNSTLSKNDLLDELEELIDEKYFVGEPVLSAGKEYIVVSAEKRGGLTTYSMEDGSKIGHRDLKRRLSVESIVQLALEDAELEENVWKVKESRLEWAPIREPAEKSTPRIASIFTPQRNNSSTGTPANRKAAEKQRIKEEKEREKAEKLKKKEEEKERKAKEKEEKAAEKQAEKRKKSGTLDKFVKKKKDNEEEGTSGGGGLFSPSKWGERRVASGVKKIEDAWKKRDQEAFQEACAWCEKNLSGAQQKTIENPIWKFAVQKLVDRSKDRAQMKYLKADKKAAYKAEMAEARKETYRVYEPKIKAWFSEDIALDDLLVTSDPLNFVDAVRVECDEQLLKCIEISQFFVSMRKILLWNENIGAEQLKVDLSAGFAGFQRSTYKMVANLLETALQEKEHEKTAHCNARLSEFPITEHTVTELVRAFFIGETEMNIKSDRRKAEQGQEQPEEQEGEPEPESEEKLEKVEEEEDQKEDQNEEEDQSQEAEVERQRILALFSDSLHMYEWPAEKQLEVLYAMKEIVHGLPIIREWFMKDANSDQLTALKRKEKEIHRQIEDNTRKLSVVPAAEVTDDMSRQQAREQEKIVKKRQNLERLLDELKDELEENREAIAREHDDLERIFRVPSIGTDRHLRKYYWFAYSSDAGIWVQDLGTTSYETWVRSCADKGLMDVETPSADLPEYVDAPSCSTTSSEAENGQVWYKLTCESAVRALEASLKKNGRREKALKKYIANNMDDILASISKRSKGVKEEDDNVEEGEDVEQVEGDVEEETPVEDSQNSDEEKPTTKFAGPMSALKTTMSELLVDWQLSGITKIGDLALFETRMDDANSFDEMKRLVIELTTSIPTEVLIEKFPQAVAIQKKCFSHLKMSRFVRRVEQATSPSCLHMLLAYFDARIDTKRTLPQLPCLVCRKKTGTERKVMCKQCASVYHHTCHRPTISREQFAEDGFKESWKCGKCKQEENRRLLKEALAQEGDASSDEEEHDDEEEHEEHDELMDEENPRGRSAKRKANVAMRDVLEFEGVLRKDQPSAPPPPKKSKKDPLPEVRELFDSIEKANPRLYKVLQNIPAPSSRSLRGNSSAQQDNRSLPEIEEDLDVYTSPDQLHTHLTAFFQHARAYVETHNARKLDELDSLISQLNFV